MLIDIYIYARMCIPVAMMGFYSSQIRTGRFSEVRSYLTSRLT
jgi:hypothetical protein